MTNISIEALTANLSTWPEDGPSYLVEASPKTQAGVDVLCTLLRSAHKDKGAISLEDVGTIINDLLMADKNDVAGALAIATVSSIEEGAIAEEAVRTAKRDVLLDIAEEHIARANYMLSGMASGRSREANVEVAAELSVAAGKVLERAARAGADVSATCGPVAFQLGQLNDALKAARAEVYGAGQVDDDDLARTIFDDAMRDMQDGARRAAKQASFGTAKAEACGIDPVTTAYEEAREWDGTSLAEEPTDVA